MQEYRCEAQCVHNTASEAQVEYRCKAQSKAQVVVQEYRCEAQGVRNAARKAQVVQEYRCEVCTTPLVKPK